MRHSAIDLIRRGRLLISEGRLSEAVECYRTALDSDPDVPGVPGALMDMGVALKDLGDYEQAQSCLRKSVELDPASGDGWFNLGSFLSRQLGNYEEAIACFRKTISCNPDDEDAICFCAEALTRLGEHGQAAALLDEHLAQRPDFQRVQAMRQQLAISFQRWLHDIADGKQPGTDD